MRRRAGSRNAAEVKKKARKTALFKPLSCLLYSSLFSAWQFLSRLIALDPSLDPEWEKESGSNGGKRDGKYLTPGEPTPESVGKIQTALRSAVHNPNKSGDSPKFGWQHTLGSSPDLRGVSEC